MPQPVTLKKLNGSMKTYKTFRTNTQKDVLFITGDWNTKVGSQEIPGVTWKFGLGVQNEAGQRLTEFYQDKKAYLSHQCKETEENNRMVTANTLFQQHKRRLCLWLGGGQGATFFSCPESRFIRHQPPPPCRLSSTPTRSKSPMWGAPVGKSVPRLPWPPR